MLVGYHILMPPGQGSFVHPAWGVYLALVSAFVMLVGGALSGRTEPPVPVLPPVPTRSLPDAWASPAGTAQPDVSPIAPPEMPGQVGSPSWSTTESVPPPGV